VMGIHTRTVDMVVWAISAAVSGIAGVALAPLFGAHFYMGVITGLKGFAAAVVGGYGNPWGALVGGLLLGVIENFGVFVIPSQWRDALTFTVLILFLLFRPHGIFRTEAYNE
jgi:branched-chain amino acid transport system permease protein